MKIISITYYIKKETDWGMNIYTDQDKKIKLPNETVDTFLEKYLYKLSTNNIVYLRQLSEKKRIPIEYQ